MSATLAQLNALSLYVREAFASADVAERAAADASASLIILNQALRAAHKDGIRARMGKGVRCPVRDAIKNGVAEALPHLSAGTLSNYVSIVARALAGEKFEAIKSLNPAQDKARQEAKTRAATTGKGAKKAKKEAQEPANEAVFTWPSLLGQLQAAFNTAEKLKAPADLREVLSEALLQVRTLAKGKGKSGEVPTLDADDDAPM